MNEPPALRAANRFVARVVDASVRARLAVLVAFAVASAAALAYAAGHFAIDTDTAKLIAEDVPFRVREAALDTAFPRRADLIAIVVDGATPEAAERMAARLAAGLARDHARFRAVWRPDGGDYFERSALLYLPPDELAATIERLIAAQPLLARLAADPSLAGLMDTLALFAEGARREPAAWGALQQTFDALAAPLSASAAGAPAQFSWTGQFAGPAAGHRGLRRVVLAQPVLDFGALEPGAAATAAIRALASAGASSDSAPTRVRLTGPVPLADEELGTLAEGAGVNAVVTMLVVVALLWCALRSLPLVGAVLASLLAGLLLTAAFGLAIFGRFNPISIAFAVLFVGLGVDFGIQFGVVYRVLRRTHAERRDAIVAAARRIGAALALAALATAAGFLAFVPTDYRGLAELGVIAGAGMLIAFGTTVTLLPALLAYLPAPEGLTDVGLPWLVPLDRALVSRRHWVLGAALALALGGAALIPRLAFDFDPLNLRSPSTESVATLVDLMRDPDATPETIEILAPSLDAAVALAARLEALPDVRQALTLASFVPDQQNEKLATIGDAALLVGPGLEPAAVRPPPTDEATVVALRRGAAALRDAAEALPATETAAAARRLAAAASALADAEPAARQRASAALIPGLTIMLAQLRNALQAAPVTLPSLPPSLASDWVAADGRARIEVYPRAVTGDRRAIERFVAAVTALAPEAAGTLVSIRASGETVVRAFAIAGAFAAAAVVILLVVALRNTRAVLLTLAPLAFAACGTLGTAAACGWPLNYANIIALPLLFGIGVAFAIYFVAAWCAGRPALAQSSLARAVLFSALTTGTAFGSLWLSHHPGTASMGRLLAISLAWLIVAALIVLPALLASVRGPR